MTGLPEASPGRGKGPTSGYLGSTSFSAVFDENHNKIGIVSVDENSGITETQIECLSSREHESKIKAGVAVLAELADFKHLNALTSRWASKSIRPRIMVTDPLHGNLRTLCLDRIGVSICKAARLT